MDFVGIKENIVDPLTKGLDKKQVQKFRMGMGLKPIIYSPTEATQPI